MFLKDRSKEKTSINIQNINSLKGVETSILGSPKGSLGDLQSKTIDSNKNIIRISKYLRFSNSTSPSASRII